MRPVYLRVFLLAVFTVFAFKTKAQTCSGSLGDPVINQNFGSGTNPGPPLDAGITNMQYTNSDCPNDGYYTIINSLTDSTNCHPYTWYNVPTDHTGNHNGYMMMVNASYLPSIFFTQQASGLCPNTTYEFSSYILNLCIPSLITAAFSQPDITFTISTTSGQILASDSTGTIPAVPFHQGPLWFKYGVYFTTPANVSDVIVTMTNNAPGGNGNDFMLDDIAFRACGPIIQAGFASINGPADKELCQGSNALFSIKAQVIGNNSPTFQWQSNTGGNGFTDIEGQNTDSLSISFVNATTGAYQYRLGVANGSNISSVQCRVYSSPLTVNVNPLPVIPEISPQTVCVGNTLQLSASGGASYIWSGPNQAPTSQNPLIINNVTASNAGTYTVQALSDSGCSATPVQVIVKVVPKVAAGISNGVSICAGESVPLSASGGLYYKWMPSTGLSNDTIPNPVATPLQTTTYTAYVNNGGCTDSSKTVTVTVYQNPEANAGPDKVLYEGQSVKLDGTAKGDQIASYYWTPATFLDNPYSLTPTATPTSGITYTLNVVSESCGTATSSVNIKVYETVTIPNTFSPNNDGINDYWDINQLNTYPECLVMVFDRYGQKVFQSTGYSQPWDGKYKGVPLSPGTYYYVIDLKDNRPKITGWVLILR